MKSEVGTIKIYIFPFIVIGLISGLVIGLNEKINSTHWLAVYLDYANINIDFVKHAEGVVYEHFAPLSLSYLLIILFAACALHRLLLGAVETTHKGIGLSFILPLRNFSLILATAFLGLMLGISLPAGLLEGWQTAARFLVLCIYPVAYLFLIKVLVMFVYHEGAHKKSEWVDAKWKYNLGTRFEGFVILLLSFFMLTYHKQFIESQDWLASKILELL